MQLRQTLAQVYRLLAGGLGGLRQQIGDADGDDDAVDGLATAVFTQQLNKAEPLPGILRLLALLSRVAACGIQQHRLIGKPPVTVTGAANTAQGRFPKAIRQRELEARVGQRGSFTRARRADDHIPRQLIEILGAKALRPLRVAVARLAEMGFLQHLRRFIKTAGQDLVFAIQPLLRIHRLRIGRILFELIHQLAVEPGVIEARHNVALGPDKIEHHDADDTVLL